MEPIIRHTKEVGINPNPFESYTVITVPEAVQRPYSLELFNSNGDKLLTQANIVSNKFILGRRDLLKGVYFYKIFNADFSFLNTGKIKIN